MLKIHFAGCSGAFRENGIDVNYSSDRFATKKTNMARSHLTNILRNPLYVMANQNVYQYLISKGYEVIDDVKAFDGIHGCFRHKRPNGAEYIKVGYHEGLVDSDTWLAVQDKKSCNKKIPNNNGAKNSWLVGLAKCGHCGYALSLLYNWNSAKTKQWRYFGDYGAHMTNGCVKKWLKIRPDEVEEAVFKAMKERLDSLIITKTKNIAFPFDISPQTSPKRRWSVRRFGSQMASQTWKCYS